MRYYIYNEENYKVQEYNVFEIIKDLIRILKKRKIRKIIFVKSIKNNIKKS